MSLPKLEQDDLLIILPNSMIGDGEAGDELSAPVVQLIHAMAQLCYWPMDFGECDNYVGELWFKRGASVEECVDQALSFIELGGYV